MALRRCHSQTVRNGASSHKIDYVAKVYDILILIGHKNRNVGLKVTAIFSQEIFYL